LPKQLIITESALVIQVRYDSHKSTFLFSKRILFFFLYEGARWGGGGEWGGDGGGVVLGEEEY
jgi:hypothetical protein